MGNWNPETLLSISKMLQQLWQTVGQLIEMLHRVTISFSTFWLRSNINTELPYDPVNSIPPKNENICSHKLVQKCSQQHYS